MDDKKNGLTVEVLDDDRLDMVSGGTDQEEEDDGETVLTFEETYDNYFYCYTCGAPIPVLKNSGTLTCRICGRIY